MYSFAETVKTVLASLEPPEAWFVLTAPTVRAMYAQQTPTALHKLEESVHRAHAATLGHALIQEVSAGIQRRDTYSRSQAFLSDARTLLGPENVKVQTQIGQRRSLESKTKEISVKAKRERHEGYDSNDDYAE
jgi:hypothetical protein